MPTVLFGVVDGVVMDGAAETELAELIAGLLADTARLLAGVFERAAVLLRVTAFLTGTFLPLPLC